MDFSKFESYAKLRVSLRTIIVGVDVGLGFLRMIKTTRSSDRKPVLLDYVCVPFPQGVSRQTPEFEGFLKSELNKFCGLRKKPFIWTSIPTFGVEIRYILIPKVPKKQIEKTVFWSIKKEDIIKEGSMFDFEVEGEVVEQNVTKLSVMVYTAPKQKVEETKALFERIGRPLTGLSIMPFAIENILRTEWVSSLERTNAVMFIGNDFSRIDIYAHGNLVLTRDVKVGMKSKVEALMEGFNKKQVTSGETGEVIELNEGQAKKLLLDLYKESDTSEGKDMYFGLKEEELFEMILPALDRLVKQIERSFSTYENKPGTGRIDKIYVSCVTDVYKPTMEYLSDQLEVEAGVIDPLESQPLCKDIATVSERVSYVPALGIAVSDEKRTPNLIHTHKEREKDSRFVRINVGVFAIFIIVVSICLAFRLIYQNHATITKNTSIIRLERQLAAHKPYLDKSVILKMVTDVALQQDVLSLYSRRYFSMAVLNELSDMTPDNIRIFKMHAYFGSSLGNDKNKGIEVVGAEGAEKKVGNMVVNGFIKGERHMLEAVLLDYVMKLQKSTLFSLVEVKESKFMTSKLGVILNFTIDIKLV